MKEVTIKISNRTMYSLIALGIIILLAIGVYAYTTDGSGNPVIMGHSPDEIAGVCQSDGTDCESICMFDGTNWVNCPSIDSDRLGFHINAANELCFDTDSTASCEIQSVICTDNADIVVWLDMSCEDAFNSDPSPSTLCDEACKSILVCDGDATEFVCGSPERVYYSTGELESCWDKAINPINSALSCMCSVSESYQREIGQNQRCIVATYSS